ncbi:DUF4315 family protein [Christensenellaceae bacterium OttesenSCG-928-K19]|nr:DUF4315 family protein [Christensenellaceae bacterium OttesenSCG-928-K19]
MNPKLQRVVRDIERTTTKIAELQALLPELERQKTELENAEVIKVFRTADIAPDDFAEFIAAYRAQTQGGAAAKPAITPSAPGYPGAASFENTMEESEDE